MIWRENTMQNAVLIGYGYWGPNIAKNLSKSKDFHFYGICDIDESKLEKAKYLYGDRIKYFTDYRDALADRNIDVCALALRNDIGQTAARAVLKSGRHLFMEKPMATNLDDALILMRLAEQNGVLIHTDHILVYHPIVKRVKTIIDSGELGEMVSFESNRTNLGPHFKRDMNAMWDLAIHDLAVLDYLCGGQSARKVECMGERRYGDQEILTYLIVKYDRFIAMIKSSWFSPLKDRTMTISGTKKMLVFDDLKESEKLMIYDKSVEIDENAFKEYGNYEAKIRLGDLYIPYITAEDSLLNSLTHFADCIREKRPSLSGPEQAIRILRILAMADEDLAKNREA
jgi:predicted dehydrogenase